MRQTKNYGIRFCALDGTITRRAAATGLAVPELVRRDLERYYASISEPVALSNAELAFVLVSAAPYVGPRLTPDNLWEFVQDGDEDDAIAAGLDVLMLSGKVRALPFVQRCAIVDRLEIGIDTD